MSSPESVHRDRRPGSRLALLAALIVVTVLTGCSSGQSEAVQPTVQSMSAFLDDAVVLDNSVITGTAQDADGNALTGVSIYIQPESSGELYQTTTGSDGAYSYSVPEGAYTISAEYEGTSLEPVDSNSVSVPPSAQVNFQLS